MSLCNRLYVRFSIRNFTIALHFFNLFAAAAFASGVADSFAQLDAAATALAATAAQQTTQMAASLTSFETATAGEFCLCSSLFSVLMLLSSSHFHLYHS
jgi:hypothetical protein